MEKENTGPGLRSRQANCSSSPIPPLFLIHCTSLVPSFIPDHLLQPPLTLYHHLQWITCVYFLLQTSFPILIAFSQPHLLQVCRGKSMDTSVREACIQTVEFQLWLSCPPLSIPNVVPISVADYLWPPLPFCSQLQWTHIFCLANFLLSPPLPVHPIIPGTNFSRHFLGAYQSSLLEKQGPLKKVGELQNVTLPPILYITFPSLILHPAAGCLLWPLLTIWPRSQDTKQIVVKHPAFLSPMNCLGSPTRNPHSLVSASNTQKHILPGMHNGHTQQNPSRIFYQATHNRHTLLRTRETTEKKRNATPTQQRREVISILIITIFPNPGAQTPSKQKHLSQNNMSSLEFNPPYLSRS